MDNESLWNLTKEALKLIRSSYEPAVEPIILSSGLDARIWGILLAAQTFEPEYTSPAHLLVRGPYTSAEQYLTRLYAAVAKGYLEEISPGEFRLTERGKEGVNQFIWEARAMMEKIDPLNQEASKELTLLFERLVKGCLATPPPPNTWSIQLSYQLMPALEPSLPFIEQAISCLYAYRDDAHLAAWRHSNLSATAFEVLTCLWREEANSLDGLLDLLCYRGHSDEVYLDALAELRDRKFIAGGRSKLRVTPEGRGFRNQVEMDTDIYFYSPWSYLSSKEKDRMEGLLVRLWDGLKERVVSA
jgi:hypothetical protein